MLQTVVGSPEPSWKTRLGSMSHRIPTDRANLNGGSQGAGLGREGKGLSSWASLMGPTLYILRKSCPRLWFY